MPEVKPSEIQTFASIKVVGVGGAGGSAVNRMKDAGLNGVQFIAMNTDAQALHNSKADVKIHLGHNTTNGLGAGADPAVGEAAARESIDEIRESLEGADMVFVTIGAGGGTGSGAGHVVAEVARDLGILTVGVATKPFSFEGEKRRANAEWAIAQLGRQVDTLISIPNDRLLQTIDRRTPLLETFKIADDVLRQGVQGIEGRAAQAAQQAIESPLIEVSIDGAKGVLFNVTGGYDMSMAEIQEAAEIITSAVSPDANIIFGATLKPELVITVIATGFDNAYYQQQAEELTAPVEQAPAVQTQSISEAVDDIDMDLSHQSAAAQFASEDTADIWGSSVDEDDEDDTPAFLRRRRKNKHNDED